VVFDFNINYNKFVIKLLLLLFALLMSFMNYDKIDCYLHAADQSNCTVENNWKY